MTGYVTGKTIKKLREQKGYTQKQLAQILQLSDKTISKWETQKGLPDISLIEPLAKALGVSVSELITGQCILNSNKSSNMLKSKFYVCPVCTNVIHSTGEGLFSCCGISLPCLEPEQCDDEHKINIEHIDNEIFVSAAHPMVKNHYISFLAYVTCDKIQFVKMYPEQNSECRFTRCGHGKIYLFCNKHGFFESRF